MDKREASDKIFSKSLTHYPQGFLLWYHRIVCALNRGEKKLARELLSECVLQFVDKTSVTDTTVRRVISWLIRLLAYVLIYLFRILSPAEYLGLHPWWKKLEGFRLDSFEV